MIVDKTHGRIAEHKSLILHVDGGCEPKNPGGAATAGWVLSNTKGQRLAEEGKVVREGGELSTNNFGEYSALVLAFSFLDKHNWEGELVVKADSKLLVEQMNLRWKCKAKHLEVLRDKARDLMDRLNLCLVDEVDPVPLQGMMGCLITWIPREQNSYANDLCREAYQRYKR